MAQVPYKPVPDVAYADNPAPYFHINAISDAFGANIGQALSHLGSQIEHSSDQLFGRAVALQQLKNQSRADELSTQYTIESSDLRAKFQSLEGKAAPDQLMAHEKDLENLRVKIGGQAENDFTRKLYDSHTRGYLGREIYSAAGHAATENKKYNKKVVNDREIDVHNEVAHRPGDPETIQAGVKTLRDLYHDRAALEHWDLDVEQSEYSKGLSKLLYTQITQMAKNNPMAADKMLKEHEVNLYGDDFTKASAIVDDHMRIQGSAVLAEQIVKPPADGKFEKSEQEYLQEADKAANVQRPDDSLFRKQLQDNVISRYRKLYGAKREFENTQKMIVDKAIVGSYGSRPTTIQELLKSDPEVEHAWQNMNDTQKKPFYAAVLNNAKIPDIERRNYENSREGLDRYQELLGMRNSNPKEFMEQTLGNEKFTPGTLQRFAKMQADTAAKAEGDPRVSHALGVIRNGRGPVMEELGIYKRTDSTKEDYDRFQGALQMWLEEFQQREKRPPKEAEILEGADQLMFRKAVPRFLGIFGGKEEPVYNISVPNTVRDSVRESVKKAGGNEPTDEEIRREYVRMQLKKLGSGTSSSKKDQSKPAKPGSGLGMKNE